MKVGKINSSQDGIIFDTNGEVQCLSSGHGNVPKILINEKEIHNTLQPGHDTNNQGGGNSMTKKHSWDIIKQINDSKESGGQQPYQQNRVYDADGILPTLNTGNGGNTVHKIKVKSATKEGFEIAKEGDSINYSQPNSKTRRGRVGVGVAQTLDTQVNQSVVVAQRGRGENNAQQLEQRQDDNTNTLTGVQKDNMLLLEGSIRRLSEIECERLQGFKDNHTKFGNYDGVVKEISRTQRYKMCGNAVTVDIVELIVRKLLPHDEIVLIDLFSGIGGFAEGLSRAGFKISNHYFSEIDRHAIANYKYNFPNAEYIGSVTDVSGHDVRAKHPTAKIFVTGGFPCQDISIAGKRKGLESGTRSSLLFEAGRIINELQCEYFLIENVKGLSSVNEGTGIIKTITFLTYLNSDHPQYTVDGQLFNTKWILPQNRERYYFIGCIRTGCSKRIFPITENDFGASEGAGDTTTVRTITGGGAFGRDAQQHDTTACVNNYGVIRDTEISTAIDANYHKGTDFHGARTLIRNKNKKQ